MPKVSLISLRSNYGCNQPLQPTVPTINCWYASPNFVLISHAVVLLISLGYPTPQRQGIFPLKIAET